MTGAKEGFWKAKSLNSEVHGFCHE